MFQYFYAGTEKILCSIDDSKDFPTTSCLCQSGLRRELERQWKQTVQLGDLHLARASDVFEA